MSLSCGKPILHALWFAASLCIITCDASESLTDEPYHSSDTQHIAPVDALSRRPPDNAATAPQCTSDTECDDGLFCNGVERCRPGYPGTTPYGCLDGVAPAGVDSDPTDCEVIGACDEENDVFSMVTLSAGERCDDGVACTTDDTCTAEQRCIGTPNDALCDDSQYCNGYESCNPAIGCTQGTPPNGANNALNDCLVAGPCDEASDSFAWVPAPIGTPCDDKTECTTSDACTNLGACSGAPNDALCDDGVFCNGAERCLPSTGCAPAIAPPSPPADGPLDTCMIYTGCNEALDGFEKVSLPPGSVCDDGTECTEDDLCDTQATCAGTPNHTLCDDDTVCNGIEICTVGIGCETGDAPDLSGLSTSICSVAFCDEAADLIISIPAPVGTSCSDGVECTVDDQCTTAGVCAGTPMQPSCDDGLFCNGAEHCEPLYGCQPGAPPTLVDGTTDDCLVTVCVETLDSLVIDKAENGTPCDDGDGATVNDQCLDGVCVGAPS